jgi:hypothetical protein
MPQGIGVYAGHDDMVSVDPQLIDHHLPGPPDGPRLVGRLALHFARNVVRMDRHEDVLESPAVFRTELRAFLCRPGFGGLHGEHNADTCPGGRLRGQTIQSPAQDARLFVIARNHDQVTDRVHGQTIFCGSTVVLGTPVHAFPTPHEVYAPEGRCGCESEADRRVCRKKGHADDQHPRREIRAHRYASQGQPCQPARNHIEGAVSGHYQANPAQAPGSGLWTAWWIRKTDGPVDSVFQGEMSI